MMFSYKNVIVVGALLGIFHYSKTQEIDVLQNVTNILPISTAFHSLPTAGNRSIPVKIIHFRQGETLEGSSSQNVPETAVPAALMIPRGFRDDFDMQPKVNSRRLQLENRFEIQVPLIPQNVTNPKWVAGELIVSEITRRQMKLIDQSRFGPLKSITFVPSVRSAILIFEKRYNPEKLAIALKYLYGIDSEPNGIITSA